MIDPRPLNILCADDDEAVRRLMAATLRRSGHIVDVAQDGGVALDKIAESPDGFDLVVTDSRMPGLDGLQLVAQARNVGYHGKFIVFAAALSPKDRASYESLAVDYIIDKPGQNGELSRAIAAISTAD